MAIHKYLKWFFEAIDRHKKSLWPSIVLLLAVIIHRPFETFFDTIIVNPLLSQIITCHVNDVIFALLFLISVAYLIYKWLDGFQIKYSWFIVFPALVFYLYIRFYSNHWEFTPFKFIPPLKYTDAAIYSLLLFINYYKNTGGNRHNRDEDASAFLSEDFSGEDLLNRRDFARTIAGYINNTKTENAFAVGILGKWGSGKSVFLQFIEEAVDESFITIKYNPWLNQTSNQIIDNFFLQIRKEIGRYTNRLDRDFIEYIGHLVKDYKTPAFQIINTFNTILSRPKTTKEIYERINSVLRDMSRKFVVFIDDLDRLDSDEVYEVLRLIRNTANFSNFVYIVAYDKDYVIGSLKKISEHQKELYLEKIFQYEFPLPPLDFDTLKYSLHNTLKKSIYVKYYEELESIFSSDAISLYMGVTSDTQLQKFFIKNIRDINRFANSFNVDMQSIGEEVLLHDFFFIELLKFKYPSLHQLLYAKFEDFFTTPEDNSANREILNVKSESIKAYLKNYHQNLSIPQEEIEPILSLIEMLFSRSGFIHTGPHTLSIRRINRFHIYFTNLLRDSNLSEDEFTRAINEDIDSFKLYVNKLKEEDKIWKLVRRIAKIRDPESFGDRRDFEKLITFTFYLFREVTDSYDLSVYLMNVLLDGNSNVFLEKLYPDDSEQFAAFVRELLLSAPFPYVKDNNLIKLIFEVQRQESFVLRPEELREIQIQYFRDYISKHTPEYNDYNIYRLYWNNINIGNEKVKAIFIKYLQDTYLQYLLTDIIENNHSQKDIAFNTEFVLKYKINEVILPVTFGSMHDFESFLDNQKSTAFLEEFKAFYHAWEQSGNKSIEYDFEVIPVKKE